MRSFSACLALNVLFSVLAMATGDEQRYGPWEVRWARTSDAAKAGGRPEWTVIFSGPEDTPDIAITGDTGPARGVAHVGRRIRVPDDEFVALAFSYKTFCQLDHRSGNVDIAIFTPEAWDKLGTSPDTSVAQGSSRDLRPTWSASLHRMSEPDVTEFREIREGVSRCMGMYARALARRDVILALVWMAAHRCPESAEFKNLRVTRGKPEDQMKPLFGRLDLENPDFKAVKTAVDRAEFATAAEELVAYFRRRYPEPPKATRITRGSMAEADMALENRFRSCGSSAYFELGKDFQWHENAIDDKEWLLHFQWHHWLKMLVEAGVIRNDERYTQKAVELIRDWLPNNFLGSQWSWRTLEVSLRAMTWTTVYPYLASYKGFTPEDHVSFLYTLAEHLDYLLPPERFHSGHNFGATESKALLKVGSAMPEFKNAKLWRDTAIKRLEGEITAQVLADGAQTELTTGYHCSVTNTFFGAADDMKRGGVEPSALYWERLEKMHEYILCLTKPDGGKPNLGDSWDGNVFSFLQRGAESFKREDMRFVASKGKAGTRPACLDTSLPVTGYYVMRTAWTDDPDGIYCLLDAAHHWGGWHQHFDALGIVLYAYGRTLTPDAGPFAYGSPLRKAFQATAAHCTLCVDEGNQDTSACTLHRFVTDECLSFIDASHDGYEGVTHRRQIMFARPGHGAPPYFIVIDRLTGDGAHTLDQHFHLFESETVVDSAKMEIRTAMGEGGNLLIRAVQRDGVSFEPRTSWIMTRYNEKTDRPDACFRQTGNLPKTFVALLLPFKGSAVPALECRLLNTPEAAGLVAVEVTGQSWRDVLLAGVAPGEMAAGDTCVDGRAALVRQTPDGTPLAHVVVGR